MTTADRNTLQALTAELVMHNSQVSEVQNRLHVLVQRRDESQKRLDQFLNAIEVSDAAPEPIRKRRKDAGTVRKAKTLLESAPKVAQPSLSGLPDENRNGD